MHFGKSFGFLVDFPNKMKVLPKFRSKNSVQFSFLNWIPKLRLFRNSKYKYKNKSKNSSQFWHFLPHKATNSHFFGKILSGIFTFIFGISKLTTLWLEILGFENTEIFRNSFGCRKTGKSERLWNQNSQNISSNALP